MTGAIFSRRRRWWPGHFHLPAMASLRALQLPSIPALDFLQMRYRPALHTLAARWQRLVSPAEVRQDNATLLAAAGEAGSRCWLVDLRSRNVPDPAELHWLTAEGRTYRVLNALGRTVSHGPAEAAHPTVEVRQLPAGLYFLELHPATGSQVRRFLKNDRRAPTRRRAIHFSAEGLRRREDFLVSGSCGDKLGPPMWPTKPKGPAQRRCRARTLAG